MTVIFIDNRTPEGKELLKLLRSSRKKRSQRILNPFPISLIEIGLHGLLDGFEAVARKLVFSLERRFRKERRKR